MSKIKLFTKITKFFSKIFNENSQKIQLFKKLLFKFLKIISVFLSLRRILFEIFSFINYYNRFKIVKKKKEAASSASSSFYMLEKCPNSSETYEFYNK